MRDTTVTRTTTRGCHNIPGQIAPGTPPNCLDCDVRLVSRASMTSAEQRHHRGRGYCSTCYFRRRTANSWDGPPPPLKQWRAADLVAEYEFMRQQLGYSRSEAAEALGVKPGSIDTAVLRARKYAVRDQARAELQAEVATAELEAHRINDDMIAYAVRKGVAA